MLQCEKLQWLLKVYIGVEQHFAIFHFMSRGLGLLMNVYKIAQGNHWKKDEMRKCVLRKIRRSFPEASCEPTSVIDDG